MFQPFQALLKGSVGSIMPCDNTANMQLLAKQSHVDLLYFYFPGVSFESELYGQILP